MFFKKQKSPNYHWYEIEGDQILAVKKHIWNLETEVWEETDSLIYDYDSEGRHLSIPLTIKIRGDER